MFARRGKHLICMLAASSFGICSKPFLSSSQIGGFGSLQGALVLLKSIKLLHVSFALRAGAALRRVKGEGSPVR